MTNSDKFGNSRTALKEGKTINSEILSITVCSQYSYLI
jgi:hypothetical protein